MTRAAVTPSPRLAGDGCGTTDPAPLTEPVLSARLAGW
jgi:hypothetical protein